MRSLHVKILTLVLITAAFLPLHAETGDGKDGIFGAASDSETIDVASESALVPLEEINYCQVMEIPKAFENKYFSVKWVGDGKVEVSVSEGYQIGFHLSSYSFPPGTQVKMNGQPWEVQILLDDQHRLFKGGETETLEVKLPPASDPAQIDLYTYRLTNGKWVEEVVKTPPHHGPSFGDNRKVHSARILNPSPDSKGTAADGGLAVPYRSQNSDECIVNGVDYRMSWCGPTSFAMVLDFYGVHKSISECADLVGYDRVKRNGTSVEGIVNGGKAAGFPNTYSSFGQSIDWLKGILAQGKPVVANVTSKNGHFVVVRGFAGDSVLINDPASRGQSAWSMEEFARRWSGMNSACVVVEK